jgi:hypothetical protein
MKRLLFVLIISFIGIVTQAQNFQFISNGQNHIATAELFKPLEHGKLYYFTDFKVDNNGFHEAYTEISKYWNLTKTISLTAQLNVGLSFNETTFKPTVDNHLGNGFHIYPVYLGGLSKSFKLGQTDVSIDVLYRYQSFLYIPLEEKQHGYQITTCFIQDLKKIQLSGYCDFWNTKYVIFEPQAWYKLFKRTWVGLEWRVSNYSDILDTDINGNQSGKYANYVMFGFKWNLE